MVARNVIYLMGALVYFCTLSMGKKEKGEFNRLLVIKDKWPKDLPGNIDALEIHETGYDVLPIEALRVKELKIQESNMTTISGSAPILKYLYLDTPALKTVSLIQIGSGLLRKKLWQNSSSVETLRITKLRGSHLPKHALRGLTSLIKFTFLQSNVVSLPAFLFSDSPNLKFIYINDNKKLEYLQSDLFSGLKQLKSLVMVNNLLSGSQLMAVTPLTSLTTLKLSDNPLQNLCADGGTSDLKVLHGLKVLELANTALSRICVDWLRDLPSLTWLDLNRNYFQSISCADLYMIRPVAFPELHIDLTENEVKNVSCSREEYESVSALTVQVSYSWKHPYLQCGCGWYWLWRIATEGSEFAALSPLDKQTCCDETWMECHPEDALRKFVEYQEKAYYMARCEVIPLDHYRRLPFLNLVTVDEVTLVGCKPPNTTYSAALQALNINVPKILNLHDVPNGTDLAASLVGLSSELKELHLHGPLHFIEFPLDLLPFGLSFLELNGTGVMMLTGKAVNVLSLKITEDELLVFNGTAPLLTELWAMAPLILLPLAPALTTLTLYAADPPPLAYSELRTLNLHYLRTRTLPDGFLRGCPRLTTFVVTKSSLSVLPEDLFSYTPDLVSVVLTDNSHIYFEREQFANLKKLLTLNLRNNLMRNAVFDAVSQLSSLTELDLSFNPLGDVCPSGDSQLGSLQQLQKLNLSNTEITRFCPDWKTFKNLRVLDLTNNNIYRINCAVMRPQGVNESGHFVLEINFNDNPLDTIDCSWLDREQVALTPKPKQKVQIYSNSLLNCNCGNYWLSLTLRELNSPVIFNASYVSPLCLDLGDQCRMRAQCPPGNKNCKSLLYTNVWDQYVINGNNFFLRYDNGSSYTAWCDSAVLEDRAWPVFPREMVFASVSLHGCVPPRAGYRAALGALNVTFTSLYIHDLPASTLLNNYSLPSPLDTLHLGAATGVLQIPGDILRNVRVDCLALVRVSGEVPQNLTRLNMTDTGIRSLPSGNYSELIINDKELTSLSGESLKLKILSVSAPVVLLPSASELSVLELVGAAPPAGFAARYPKLRTLRLHRLAFLLLPYQLLQGASHLRHLKMTQNKFTSLPTDLLSFSPNLISVDLSDNELQLLPRGLFYKLKGLETLKLNSNRLTVAKMVSLAPLVALRHLNLQDNPIGNLCTGNTSVLSSLEQLQVLEISRTSASHVCADWLTNMRSLHCIDMRHNAVREISCKALASKTAPEQNGPFIDLTDNPIDEIDCYDELGQTEMNDPSARVLTNDGLAHFIPTNRRAPCNGDWIKFDPQARTSISVMSKKISSS